jgi:type VI secretion system secreted protein Hcp
MPLAALLQLSDIKGMARQKGAEGNIMVAAFTHEVHADLDPVTLKPNGNRTHGALVVTKNIDFGTPAIHEAHENKTKMNATLRLIRIPRSGPEFNYLTIHLTEAQIVSVNLVMPFVHTNEPIHEYEEVSFIYKAIAYENHSPKEGMEKDTIVNYKVNDPDGALSRPLKFQPEWQEEKAKWAVKKIYEMAKDQAKKEVDAKIKEMEEKKDK